MITKNHIQFIRDEASGMESCLGDMVFMEKEEFQESVDGLRRVADAMDAETELRGKLVDVIKRISDITVSGDKNAWQSLHSIRAIATDALAAIPKDGV